jgi:hypothetical protein
MNANVEIVLSVAEIVRDSVAMNDAALAGDFDEARFRAQIVAAKADRSGFVGVALAVAHLVTTLGPMGSNPRPGYGADMLRVASALEVIGFDPL